MRHPSLPNRSPPAVPSHHRPRQDLCQCRKVLQQAKLNHHSRRIEYKDDSNDGQWQKQLRLAPRRLRTSWRSTALNLRWLIVLESFFLSVEDDLDNLYGRLLEVLRGDHKRTYYLVQHARHSCFGLVQCANNPDRVIGLFEYMDKLLPSVPVPIIVSSSL